MKSIGIVRKIDNLGRLCLPVEIRRILGLKLNSPMEFYMDGENVVIRKYEPSCVFCKTEKNTIKFADKLICLNCLKNASELYLCTGIRQK